MSLLHGCGIVKQGSSAPLSLGLLLLVELGCSMAVHSWEQDGEHSVDPLPLPPFVTI